jgi:membrane protease YdiL (CAAX protease family)
MSAAPQPGANVEQDAVYDTGNLHPTHDSRSRNRLVWLLIAGMLILRIPFLAGMRYFTWTSTASWVMPIFEVGTYVLTAILIWLERDRLADHHVDLLALIILIVGKPLELLLSGFSIMGWRSLRSSAYLLYLPVAAAPLVGLVIARPAPARCGARKWLWLGVGVVAGIAAGAFSGWLSRLEFAPPAGSSITPGILIVLPVQQLLYAGIAEEPVFRGFLWGALRRAGWKDAWVLLLQWALFWLAHIYWLDRSPVTFWVIVPLGGLVLGALAWGARSIGVSMIAHGLLNGVLNIVFYYRFP